MFSPGKLNLGTKLGVGLALLLANGTRAGHAQDVPRPQPPPDAAAAPDAGVDAAVEPTEIESGPAALEAAPEPERRVVTGSHLSRGGDADQASSVDVVETGDSAKSTARDAREAVANMPSNNAGAESETESGGGQVNLRGLGAGTTLVLLNGRRVLGTGLTDEGQPFYRLAAIPIAMVERVEVLKGGASAIYGSDAIAGVVNYITRRKFDGLNLQASGNLATQRGGLRDGEVSVLWGKSNERGGVTVMLSYFERTGLEALDRDFSQGDPSRPRFPFKDQPVPATGVPAEYARPLTISSQGNPSTFLFTHPSPMGSPLDPDMSTVPTRISELRPDPDCLSGPSGTFVQQQNYVEFMSDAELVARQGERCGFSYAPYYSYIHPERRLQAYATLDHSFSDHVQAFGELGYVRVEGDAPSVPSFLLTREVSVPPDHPDIPEAWREDALNTTQPILLIGRTRGGEYDPNFSRQSWRDDSFRVVAGLRGDLADVARGSWAEHLSWELSATYQQQYSTENAYDDITDNLQRSLNACTEQRVQRDESGSIIRDAGGNPITVANPDYGRIPCFHPFYAQQRLNDTDDSNALGATATDYVRGTWRPIRTMSMTVADAVVRGSALQLPGGEIGFAIGAQARRDAVEYSADHDNQIESFGFLIGTPSWRGARNVFATYAELALPVLREFDVQAAARYEHYENVGGSADPKLSLRLRPFARAQGSALQRLSLHGSVATSFRGPSLLQLKGQRVITANFSGTFRPQRTEGNPDLEPEQSVAFDAGAGWRFGGASLDFEYWHYRYKDIVTIENAQAIWNRCDQALEEGLTQGLQPQSVTATDARCFTQSGRPAIELDSTGVLNSVTAEFINASSIKVHGLDFALGYRFGRADTIGTINLGAVASYLLSYKGRADGNQRCPAGDRTAPGCEREFAGSRNALTFAPSLPRLRMTFPVSWSRSGHTLQATGNLVGSYRNDETTPEQPIPAWFTLNLQYSYRLEGVIGKATTFTLGATNVADADPPYVQTLLGYDGNQHDPRGRMLYARFSQEL